MPSPFWHANLRQRGEEFIRECYVLCDDPYPLANATWIHDVVLVAMLFGGLTKEKAAK